MARSHRAVVLSLALVAPALRPVQERRAARPRGAAGGGSDPVPPVTPAVEPVLLRAWAEPRLLPAGGGQAQIMVRVRKRGGEPFPGVEVRCTSGGARFFAGRVLVTDASGMTRDRLTAQDHHGHGGRRRHRFQVPVDCAGAARCCARPTPLVEDLERILAPERVLARPIDRLGRSADASIYRLIPQVVVRPRDLAEVRELFAYARARTAVTSPSAPPARRSPARP